MKSLALVVGALILIAGLAVILFPAAVLALASRPITPLQLYASAVIRVGLGVLFVSAAKGARLPRFLKLIGGILLLAGIGTLALGVHGASLITSWISQQNLSVVRLLGTLPLTLGSLVIYACGAPQSSPDSRR